MMHCGGCDRQYGIGWTTTRKNLPNYRNDQMTILPVCVLTQFSVVITFWTARWCSGWGVGLAMVRLPAGALPGSLGQLSLLSLRGR